MECDFQNGGLFSLDISETCRCVSYFQNDFLNIQNKIWLQKLTRKLSSEKLGNNLNKDRQTICYHTNMKYRKSHHVVETHMRTKNECETSLVEMPCSKKNIKRNQR